jgi:hypothetical protein
MSPMRLAAWSPLILALAASACTKRERPAPAADQAAQVPERDGVRRDRRFGGFVRLQTGGRVDSVRVELVNLDLHGGVTAPAMDPAFDGSLIIHLVAGKVTSSIDSVEQPRTQGEVWSVPAGKTVKLTSGTDAASLQIMAVQPK